MAGTGHSYEIGNVSSVRKTVERLADGFPEGPGKDWLRSRKVLRYLTSPRFTFSVERSDPEDAAALFDEDGREFLVAKLKSGVEVRLFSPEVYSMIQASDGGLAHVADWIMWLSVNDPKLYAKLPRITVEQAQERASEDWAGTKGAPAPLSRGREETVVATPAGRTWVELLDGTALRAEGSVMSHCVASYESVLGQRRIMSLRDRAGRSIVTVEFRCEAGKPTLWQASAFANTPVPAHAQLCLAHLMEHLGAEGAAVAAAAGITRDHSGAWRRIVDVWNRETWMGMTGVSLGQDLVLMSPRDPSRTLLKVRFASVDWREQDAPVGFVSALEHRHFHIDEQRAFAAVLNAVNDDALSSYGPAMAYVDGKAIPQRDTMERREIGGVACLVEKGMVGRGNDGLSLISTRQAGEIIHVVHSRDSARTLLRIEWDHERFRGVLAVHPMDAARWSPGEARRCMAVMTAMKAPFFSASRDTEDARAIQKRYQPVRSMDGRWYSFLEEAQSLPALTGCPGVWRHTRDRAELSANKFGNVVIQKNADDKVVHIYALLASAEMAAEVAAFLNDMDWKPGRRITGSWSPEGERSPVYYLLGRWRAAVDVEGFIREATGGKRMRRIRRMEEIEAESVFAVLPEEGGDGDADYLLASAVDAWSRIAVRKGGSDLPLSPLPGHSYSGGRLRWSMTYEGRLAAAKRLWPLLSEATHKRIERIAAASMRGLLKGWRKQYFHPHVEPAAKLLESFPYAFSDALFQRALKKVLAERRIPIAKGAAAPHPAWFGAIAERAAANGCNWQLGDACDYTSVALKDDAVLDVGSASIWLACFRAASGRRWHYHATQAAGRLLSVIERSAESQDGDWLPILEEARVLKALLESREDGWNRLAA